MQNVSRSSRLNGATVVIAVLVSAVLLSGCDWYQYRGNAAHTGAVGEKVIGVGNVASLRQSWVTNDGNAGGYTAAQAPVVAGGRLYVQDAGGSPSAYDARGVKNCGGSPKECRPVWTAQLTGGTSPAVVGGVVFNTVGGVLSAYDATGSTGCSGTPPTCQPLWTASVGDSAAAPPTVAGGVVYVTALASPDDVLFAFDAAGEQSCTGTPKVCAPLWTATFGGNGDANAGGSSPAVANGRVFVPGGDHAVHVFDAAGQQGCGGTPKTCTALWTATIPLPCPANQSPCDISVPAVANGVLYVNGDGDDFVTTAPVGGLYAFDATGTTSCTGSPKQCSPLWSTTSPTLFAPAIANGVVYTVSDAADGTLLRAFDAAGVEGCTGTPTICAPLWTSTTDLVQVGDEGLTPQDEGTSAPVVANGVVYVVGVDHMVCDIFCTVIPHLYAFDGSGVQGCTGTPKRCAPVFDHAGSQDYGTFGEPVVANGTVYVGDAGFGEFSPQVTVMHAFRPSSG